MTGMQAGLFTTDQRHKASTSRSSANLPKLKPLWMAALGLDF
jgi:hypothetical protein